METGSHDTVLAPISIGMQKAAIPASREWSSAEDFGIFSLDAANVIVGVFSNNGELAVINSRTGAILRKDVLQITKCNRATETLYIRDVLNASPESNILYLKYYRKICRSRFDNDADFLGLAVSSFDRSTFLLKPFHTLIELDYKTIDNTYVGMLRSPAFPDSVLTIVLQEKCFKLYRTPTLGEPQLIHELTVPTLHDEGVLLVPTHQQGEILGIPLQYLANERVCAHGFSYVLHVREEEICSSVCHTTFYPDAVHKFPTLVDGKQCEWRRSRVIDNYLVIPVCNSYDIREYGVIKLWKLHLSTKQWSAHFVTIEQRVTGDSYTFGIASIVNSTYWITIFGQEGSRKNNKEKYFVGVARIDVLTLKQSSFDALMLAYGKVLCQLNMPALRELGLPEKFLAIAAERAIC